MNLNYWGLLLSRINKILPLIKRLNLQPKIYFKEWKFFYKT